MFNRICFAAMAFFMFAATNSVAAHEVFQDVLKEQYLLRSFSCKTCHAEKDKKLRTKFAERIHQEMKQFGYSKKFEIATKADEVAKAKDPKSVGKDKGAVYELEKEMAVEFKKAFVAVAKQKMTIGEMLEQGLLAGARLDPKKIKAAKKAKEESGEPGDGPAAGGAKKD
jgi:hypothetical protein